MPGFIAGPGGHHDAGWRCALADDLQIVWRLAGLFVQEERNSGVIGSSEAID
jgi:hypothetical protein